MRRTIPATAITCTVLFLLGCDGGPTTPTGGPAKPQLERVENGGCPPVFRPILSGVGVDPDRNGDGIVCLWDGTKREQTPPPIDNNIPPVQMDEVGMASAIAEIPPPSTSSITVNRCSFTFTTQPMTLSPPDHKYVQLSTSDLVPGFSDSCDPDATIARNGQITCIRSDEAEDASGADGSTLVDMTINSPSALSLRAERDPKLNGRVYTVAIQVIDGFDNLVSTTATVTVPVNKQEPAVWGPGPGYSIGAGPRSCS